MPKPTKKHKFRSISFLKKKKTQTSVPSEEAAGTRSSVAFSSQSLVDDKLMPTISECNIQPFGFLETDNMESVTTFALFWECLLHH